MSPDARGRVIREDRTRISVLSAQHELSLPRGAGGFVVGDWVELAEAAGPSPRVVRVLDRRGVFLRKRPDRDEPQAIASNVDVLLVVTAMDADFSTHRLQRGVALAHQGGARPVVVLNKADECEDLDEWLTRARAAVPGVDVISLSALTGAGCDAVAALAVPGATVALIGSSGVGKSTLVNTLLGEDRFATAAVREEDAKGRHTTTARQLALMRNGAWLLDTPGMRELGLWDADEGVAATFRDVGELAAACRFRDCRHESEPGCAVRAAIDEGTLDEARLEDHRKLERELAHQARKQRGRGEDRQFDRARGRMYKDIQGQKKRPRD